MPKFVTAAAAPEALGALLPWVNGEQLHPTEIQGRIVRFLSTPIAGSDLLLGLGADDGYRLAAGRVPAAQLRQLRRDLRDLLADVAEARARPWPKRLWRWPTLGYARVVVTRRRRPVAVTWLSGGLRDLLLYAVWYLLTGLDALTLGHCPAPAAGNWSRRCDNWFIVSGGRRGPRGKYCAQKCRVRAHRKIESAKRRK
jgi:hypothetical protein